MAATTSVPLANVHGKFKATYDLKNMRLEVKRLKTFKTWSKSCPIRPPPLAEAGFFYLGIFDRVECFSCRVQVDDWKKGQTAMGRHEEENSQCKMVNNEESGNITIKKWNEMKKLVQSTGPISQSKTETDGEVVLDSSYTSSLITSDDYVDAFCGTPFSGMLSLAKYPEHTGELDRLDTFRDKWSDEFKLPSSALRWLANAGFFKDGPGDRTRCFYCGGGVECWEEDDEPWCEHARNFPTCTWLLDMKGEEFVNDVQDYFKNKKAREEEENKSRDTSTASALNHQNAPASVPNKRGQVSANDLVKMMDSPTVRIILKTGFDASLVCRVLEEQLRQTGIDFSSSDNFIKALEAAEKTNPKSPVPNIEMQTQRLAVIDIDGGHRQDHSYNTRSDQNGFGTSRSSNVNQPLPTSPRTGYPQTTQDASCLICRTQDVATKLLPCNHEVACLQCTRVAVKCPSCGIHITSYRRITFDV
nr:baculoviral IAP repeat-containing protein 3-like [Lytechinus pictus]